jgi:hypothetical protein
VGQGLVLESFLKSCQGGAHPGDQANAQFLITPMEIQTLVCAVALGYCLALWMFIVRALDVLP